MSESEITEREREGRPPPNIVPFNLNYATPLIGQFLNLPKEPVQIKCPSCGCFELTDYESDLTTRSEWINGCFSCAYVYCCLCFCMETFIISKDYHGSHYCKNCGCYFGRHLENRKKLRA